MDRKRIGRSHEPLLGPSKPEESIPLRSPSSFRSSFDSDFDTADYLDTDLLSKTARSKTRAYASASTLSRLQGFLSRNYKHVLFSCAFVLVLWTMLGSTFIPYQTSTPLDDQSPPWYPTPIGGSLPEWKTSYEKAAELVKKMSLVEKVNITTGTGWQMGLAVGQTGPALEAGFPGLALQDGPLGIRFSDNATAFPAGITVGATWNKELMYQRGKAHGQEARLKGVNVLLGPCVGPLGRMPAGGRNWEGFGSDPYLQGIAAAETIRGIQEEGVMATIKHFIGNEQEHFRQAREWANLDNALSSNIDDRTLHELYLWPFADAVRAGVASVMCSYQRLNNSYACSNSKLMNGILKDELGFQGFVQSDWLAQRSGVASALAGLDMTMPGDGLAWTDGKSLWGPHLTLSILNGSLPVSRLNDMVTRIVASWYQLGQDDKTKFDGKGPNFSSWTNDRTGLLYPGSPDDHDVKVVNQFVNVQGSKEHPHADIARKVAVEGTVLLKNEDHILPLSEDGWPKDSNHELKFRVGIFGEDAGAGKGPNACPDRGCNQGTLGSGWGSGAVEFPYLVSPAAALKTAFNDERVYVTEFPTNTPPMRLAPAILKDQDVCILFANSDAGEGYLPVDDIKGDRNDLELQNGAELLVKQVAQGCGGGKGKTIVVVHAVGPVVMENWINIPGVKAVVMANLPGQESGNAIADILLGRVNPSGKLPYTIGKSLDDYGPGAKVMYTANGPSPQQDFTEGLYIDYRYFDKYEIAPRFEFGFGLSYTTFKYSNLVVKPLKEKTALPQPRPQSNTSPAIYDDSIPDPAEAVVPKGFRRLAKYIYPYIEKVSDVKKGTYPYPDGYNVEQPLSQAGGGQGGNPSLYDTFAEVSVDITNTGSLDGQEVAQLYIAYPGSATAKSAKAEETDFPVKVLRGFEKVLIKKGAKQTVTFKLTRRDLSYWDVVQQNWVMPTEGQFKVFVGASSRDLQTTGVF